MHYNLLNRKGRVQWTSMKLIENSPGRITQKKRLVERFVKILSGVCLLSGFLEKFLSSVCLSGFCLSRFCRDFVRIFKKKTLSVVTVLVRRLVSGPFSWSRYQAADFTVGQISSLRISHTFSWSKMTLNDLSQAETEYQCEKPRKYQYFCFGLARKVTGNERSLTQKFESIPKKRLFLNNNRWSSRLIPTKISTNRPNKKYSNSDWEKFWNIF